MKFVSFLNKSGEERVGLSINNKTIDISNAAKKLSLDVPSKIVLILENASSLFPKIKKIQDAYLEGKLNVFEDDKLIKKLAPIPKPTSCRDGYAFRQHVEAARRNRGAPMIPEFDEFPVFYFTNHNAIVGEGSVVVEQDHLDQLDFELEWACVIGKRGKNISVQDADSYIIGFTIMNDFSARKLQMQEMKLSLGPAKGKDFATALGPWLVTVDELKSHEIKTPQGSQYNLEMKAYHNGKCVSEGNAKTMSWTFAQIIERASYGVELLPGDVIGSGTVGTGCYLELNGTWAGLAKERGEGFTPVWLKEGDTIELEIEGLGRLQNQIKKNHEKHSG